MCGAPHATEDNPTNLILPVDTAHTDITQSIYNSFRNGACERNCEQCAMNQPKTQWTEIVAAPKILRIHLQILMFDLKIFHTLAYPEHLDLTFYQQFSTLPLKYELSSVVAHRGDYIDAEDPDKEVAMQMQKKLDAEYAAYMQAKLGGKKDGKQKRHSGTSTTSEDSDLAQAIYNSLQTEPPSDPKSFSPTEPPSKPNEPAKKILQGHYIACTRCADGTFTCIDDTGVRQITRTQFLTNPQQSAGSKFQAYLLTYIRDDSERYVPASKRWVREVTKLKVDGDGNEGGTEAGEETGAGEENDGEGGPVAEAPRAPRASRAAPLTGAGTTKGKRKGIGKARQWTRRKRVKRE